MVVFYFQYRIHLVNFLWKRESMTWKMQYRMQFLLETKVEKKMRRAGHPFFPTQIACSGFIPKHIIGHYFNPYKDTEGLREILRQWIMDIYNCLSYILPKITSTLHSLEEDNIFPVLDLVMYKNGLLWSFFKADVII